MYIFPLTIVGVEVVELPNLTEDSSRAAPVSASMETLCNTPSEVATINVPSWVPAMAVERTLAPRSNMDRASPDAASKTVRVPVSSPTTTLPPAEAAPDQ